MVTWTYIFSSSTMLEQENVFWNLKVISRALRNFRVMLQFPTAEMCLVVFLYEFPSNFKNESISTYFSLFSTLTYITLVFTMFYKTHIVFCFAIHLTFCTTLFFPFNHCSLNYIDIDLDIHRGKSKVHKMKKNDGCFLRCR